MGCRHVREMLPIFGHYICVVAGQCTYNIRFTSKQAASLCRNYAVVPSVDAKVRGESAIGGLPKVALPTACRTARPGVGESGQQDVDQPAAVDPEAIMEALPEEYFEPVSQLDWETSIIWDDAAVNSADAQMTQLTLADEDNEEEEVVAPTVRGVHVLLHLA